MELSNWLIMKRRLFDILYTKSLSWIFLKFGKKSIIGCSSTFRGTDRIEIGSHTIIGRYAVITAWKRINNDFFIPKIFIGNNCSIGEYVHITATNSITIGNNVLLGRRVTISDNSHGKNLSCEELQIPPNHRRIYSKGEVIIEDNVWIGDKATILAGVRIGYASIVGANAVVTADVPPYSIVGGVPAKVLRTVE